MPSDAVFKVANRIHKTVMTLTGGRVGSTMAKMPVLELTTTGRKTGKQRSTLLTAPWRDGDKIALVASAGGNDHHPSWYLNLRDNPDVNVRMEGRDLAMTARVLEGDERAALLDTITTEFRNYDGYLQKTTREIPVIVLEPAN